jgi:hypothetical protein
MKPRCVASIVLSLGVHIWGFQMVFNVSSKAAVMASELWRVNGWYEYDRISGDSILSFHVAWRVVE